MVHSNNKQTSTNNVPQAASQCRNGKTHSASRKRSETDGTRAHRSLFSKTAAILFAVACIFLKHQDDFERQEEYVAKVQVYNRAARKLAMTIEEGTPSDEELEVEEMDMEQYGDDEQTYEGAYEDVEEPYEEPYEDAEEGIYSNEQWEEEGEEDDYEEQEEEAILEEWTPEEQQVQEEVHYDGEGNIQHGVRQEEVDNGDILPAEVSVTEPKREAAPVENSGNSDSKVESDGPLPASQNNEQSVKATKKPAGRSSTPKHISTTNKRWVGFGVSNSAFNTVAGFLYFVPVLQQFWITIFLSAAGGSIVVVLLILLYLCIRGKKWSRKSNKKLTPCTPPKTNKNPNVPKKSEAHGKPTVPNKP
ncbi:hypothetical protein AK88_00165 [Plasmodium fragile]|uniref:Uncharacterized protein n=1 Tax=Plasmodium fragile TaxID=5857 RepID=A0A0D9QTQ6_PLAFR|nr:uncharacterized protein AK88_00165 [Plasmodium fragile]KJP90317.1 hypothetical protein AK88_00165 [Plasmodium fragile]